MQDLSNRLKISSLYVSFPLTPLNINFVEVLKSSTFASEKAKLSITVLLTNLFRAVIVNKTFN